MVAGRPSGTRESPRAFTSPSSEAGMTIHDTPSIVSTLEWYP
jgi:hypothetical protein